MYMYTCWLTAYMYFHLWRQIPTVSIYMYLCTCISIYSTVSKSCSKDLLSCIHKNSKPENCTVYNIIIKIMQYTHIYTCTHATI